MQINATQIREGMILDLEGELYKVTYTQHVTPGKGVACMQTKLKNLQNGKNLEQRFRSSERVEKAELETKNMQYLYEDSGNFMFMDNTDYEQHALPSTLLGDQAGFLVENDNYPVEYYDGNPIGILLPLTVDLKVDVAPPEIKKATAAASLRPITLENGMVVNAPSFIKEGDTVKISTETRDYIERVK